MAGNYNAGSVGPGTATRVSYSGAPGTSLAVLELSPPAPRRPGSSPHGSRRTEKAYVTWIRRSSDLTDITGLRNPGTRRMGAGAKFASDKEIGRTCPAGREALACPSSQRTQYYPVPYTSPSAAQVTELVYVQNI